jgi:hypothetical protein
LARIFKEMQGHEEISQNSRCKSQKTGLKSQDLHLFPPQLSQNEAMLSSSGSNPETDQ